MNTSRKTTHYFSSTADAYDSCQMGEHVDTDEPVQKGDILIIESERVIGVAHTWPVAVTREHGELHIFQPAQATEAYCAEHGFPLHQVRHAQALASDANW